MALLFGVDNSLLWEVTLCSLVASLASTYHIPVIPFHLPSKLLQPKMSLDTAKCPLEGQNHQLRTDLDYV